MRFQIENIAKVKSANVKLNGLTVIAGENGSGKSMAGKMPFSVILVPKSTQSNNIQKPIPYFTLFILFFSISCPIRFFHPFFLLSLSSILTILSGSWLSHCRFPEKTPAG